MTLAKIKTAAEELAERDDRLALVLETHGPPPLLRRAASFATLIHIILEQQVSVESAKSTFDRLQATLGHEVNAESV
ncbi:MAG: hypothetical protein AAGJ83_12370, partial [Planctomycetota bacterium]